MAFCLAYMWAFTCSTIVRLLVWFRPVQRRPPTPTLSAAFAIVDADSSGDAPNPPTCPLSPHSARLDPRKPAFMGKAVRLRRGRWCWDADYGFIRLSNVYRHGFRATPSFAIFSFLCGRMASFQRGSRLIFVAGSVGSLIWAGT